MRPRLSSPLESLIAGEPNQSVGDIERNLSPAEMGIVNYHRNTIASGQVGRDAQGRPVTVYSQTIKIPGTQKFATVPGYFDGQMHDDENDIYDRWKDEISAGKWPSYDDPRVAGQRAKYIHGIMDSERGGQ